MTDSKRQKDYKTRLIASGLKRIEIWIRQGDKAAEEAAKRLDKRGKV